MARQSGAQLRIGHLPGQVATGEGDAFLTHFAIAQKGNDTDFEARENQLAKRPRQNWEAPEALPPCFGNRNIEPGNDPS